MENFEVVSQKPSVKNRVVELARGLKERFNKEKSTRYRLPLRISPLPHDPNFELERTLSLDSIRIQLAKRGYVDKIYITYDAIEAGEGQNDGIRKIANNEFDQIRQYAKTKYNQKQNMRPIPEYATDNLGLITLLSDKDSWQRKKALLTKFLTLEDRETKYPGWATKIATDFRTAYLLGALVVDDTEAINTAISLKKSFKFQSYDVALVPFDKILALARLPQGLKIASDMISNFTQSDSKEFLDWISQQESMPAEIKKAAEARYSFHEASCKLHPTGDDFLDKISELNPTLDTVQETEKETQLEDTARTSGDLVKKELIGFYKSVKATYQERHKDFKLILIPNELWNFSYDNTETTTSGRIIAIFAELFDITPHELIASALQPTGRETKVFPQHRHEEGVLIDALGFLNESPEYAQKYKTEIQTLYRFLFYMKGFRPDHYRQMLRIGRADSDHSNYLIPITMKDSPFLLDSERIRKEGEALFAPLFARLDRMVEQAKGMSNEARLTRIDIELASGGSGRPDKATIMSGLNTLGIGMDGDETVISKIEYALALLKIDKDIADILKGKENNDPLKVIDARIRALIKEIGAPEDNGQYSPRQTDLLRPIAQVKDFIKYIERKNTDRQDVSESN